ncbi:AAA domain-containing protein, putative AbiEii toxin, Type IV TA system [Thiothrix caldifontis]|uniref:AAA domain-containing protein, putative AbiEii toxin, Type IV TA system n=1 Tax=Thiothrix caldifontis TaxID=525918 RepID=A0A1H4CGR8_9GAMM|nr:AAA family ATPase [Thiothrix caldifontis]SEA59242.1 AAA domain-containing protein, putative AbiEii toxin, Type IV TA system [Thiothrix caldifontis]
MISKVWLPNLDKYGYTSDKKINEKPYMEISKINLIIGANNSGKSRFLRELFKGSYSDFYIEDKDFIEKFADKISPVSDLILRRFSQSYLNITQNSFNLLSEHGKNIQDFLRIPNNLMFDSDDELDRLKEFFLEQGKFDEIKKLIKEQVTPTLLPRFYYIPVLRGMRPLNILENSNEKNLDLLKTRTINDYFMDSKHCQGNIITGHDLYDKLQHFLLGQPEERDMVREYEKLLGNEFFNGKAVTLIPEIKRDVVAIKIGDERQFPIFDLGDGLQQVIIITSALYLTAKPSLFFIEEPEIGLHPGLLKRLVDFLIKHTRHQYFLTTHSNHLFDSYHNYDCITLHKITKKLNQSNVAFEITDCEGDRTILSDLGVSPSSIYLSNSTIWVEGITDRLYLRCFMRKYIESQCDTEKLRLQRYLENYHYSFVEYQGGTLGHWNFDDDDVDGGDVGGLCAVKLCANAFLIADGDIKSKGNRLDTLTSQLGDKLYVTKGKELENMLPDVVVKKVAGEIFENSRKEKESLNKNSIESLAFENYSVSDEGIGFHLDKCFGLQGKGKESKRFFAEGSGTIINKVPFCNLAVSYMISDKIEWDLTDDLRDLCKKIFNHIESCNCL